MRNLILLSLCIVITLPVAAQTSNLLFEDDFDSDTSSDWLVFRGSASGGVDTTAAFSYDYSADGIPPASRSLGGTTRGLKLTANNDFLPGEAAGISLYPEGQHFSGNYRLTADLWLNIPDVGTTEFINLGINHTGTRVNYTANNVEGTSSITNATESDGLWFSLSGDGDALRDYRSYIAAATEPILLNAHPDYGTCAAGFPFNATDDTCADNGNFQEPYLSWFASPPYNFLGVPAGGQWAIAEIEQLDGTVTWRINGHVILTRAHLSGFTAGNIMLGYMDPYDSIASPADASFGLIDNVKVEQIVPSPTPVISGTGQEWQDYR